MNTFEGFMNFNGYQFDKKLNGFVKTGDLILSSSSGSGLENVKSNFLKYGEAFEMFLNVIRNNV